MALSDRFIKELLENIKKKNITTQISLNSLKNQLSKRYNIKKPPTNIEILLSLKDPKRYKSLFLTKPTRTLSGVSVVAVMTPPQKCPHGRCLMCPGGPDSEFGDVPQSYTGKEPATRRAIRNLYDPYLQVMNRLEQYIVQGHPAEKIELIIMGGTFPSLDKSYQENFVKYCFKAMNDFSYLFYDKDFNIERFKKFFELPGDITDKKREESIRNRLLLIKNLELKDFLSKDVKDFIDNLEIDNKKAIDLKNNGFNNNDKDNNENLKLRNNKNSRLKIENKSINKNIKIYKETLKRLKTKKITLSEEQLKNESSNIRCIGLTLETRPDYARLDHANFMLELGCTRIELGIQTTDDKVLKKIQRGHTVEDSIQTTKVLKDLGFKINYHVMPGLPSEKDSLKMLKEIFEDENLRPDMLKIYPCMVLKGTKLYNEYKKGKFRPLTTEQAAKLIAKFKSVVPEYCRIMRVQRDIPTFMTTAGVDKTNLRQYIDKYKTSCRCIRCREIGRTLETIKDYKITVMPYPASEGQEFFIQAEKNDVLIGFCRLRFPSQQLRKETTEDSALVRELHVYGETIEIGKKGNIQHKGIGKKLLQQAELIAKQNNKKKIIVISGIGVRNYYKKLGYKKQGVYMVKVI